MLSFAQALSHSTRVPHTASRSGSRPLPLAHQPACPTPTRCWVLDLTHTGLQSRKLRGHARRSPARARSSAQTEQPATPVQQHGFEWATNVSRHGNVYFAIDETTQACKASMRDSSSEPTVALFFASSSYSVEFDRIIPVLRSKVPSLQHIIGCTVRSCSFFKVFRPQHWLATCAIQALIAICTLLALMNSAMLFM